MSVVAERIKVEIRASGAHPDVLTVQDAMRQVLDIFELLNSDKSGVEWKLASATTNSPFLLEGEAVSLEPSVDVSVIARAQKADALEGLRDVARGKYPSNWEGSNRITVAKRLFRRNLNGVGSTKINFDIDEVVVTPVIAQTALNTLELKVESHSLFDLPPGKQEVGSLEGTFADLTTYRNLPAVRIIEAHTKRTIWCRLSNDLQEKFGDKATFKDIWEHKRVIVRGRIKYDDDGKIDHVFATDIQKLESKSVGLERIKDRDFTGGLSIVEYLDRFREGSLG